MRQALAGIVPDEILNRKRKAFVVRSPTLAVTELEESLTAARSDLLAAEFGIIDPDRLHTILAQAKRASEVPVVLLLRTLEMEIWLRNACDRHILKAVSLKETTCRRKATTPGATRSKEVRA
jgi:asparagine synthase (glutamine-hydrolysing)